MAATSLRSFSLCHSDAHLCNNLSYYSEVLSLIRELYNCFAFLDEDKKCHQLYSTMIIF